MSDLAPEDRAVLDLARGGYEPTLEDRVRVRGSLFARIGVGAGVAATTTAASKAAAMTLLWTKVITTIVVGTAVGSAGIVGYRAMRSVPVDPFGIPSSHPGAERPSRLADTPALPAESSPLARVPALEDLGRPQAPARTAVRRPDGKEPSPVVSAPRIPGAKPVLSPAPQSPLSSGSPPDSAQSPGQAPDPGDVPGGARGGPRSAPLTDGQMSAPRMAVVPTTLEAETRLIQSGVRALHAGDGARALALFDEHARLFQAGALAEERAAERVAALGQLQRCDEARAAAAAFAREHPNSPLTARVRAVCVSPSNP